MDLFTLLLVVVFAALIVSVILKKMTWRDGLLFGVVAAVVWLIAGRPTP